MKNSLIKIEKVIVEMPDGSQKVYSFTNTATSSSTTSPQPELFSIIAVTVLLIIALCYWYFRIYRSLKKKNENFK